MSPILAILALAFVVGLALRGSPREFGKVQLHWWGLALAGVALQSIAWPTLPGLSPDISAAVLLCSSYVFLLAFITVNRWIPAAGVMAIGLVLNLAVVSANGGMPVSAAAIRAAGGSADALIALPGAKHHVMHEDTVLTPLADVIPIPRPVGVVLSIGDVLLYLGAAWLVIQVMRGRSRENPRPLAVWFLSYRGKHCPPYWRMPARYRAHRAATAPPGNAH
jgi:Family of unknown function (DUF5317)